MLLHFLVKYGYPNSLFFTVFIANVSKNKNKMYYKSRNKFTEMRGWGMSIQIAANVVYLKGVSFLKS